jgi:hypothetical protein
MIDLYGYPLAAIFLLGLAVIWGVSEIGWQLGTRCGGSGSGNFSTLESATLGLLALIIGFTFAMALSRFEARRDAIVNEANATGTTALRARLLPQPYRTETLNLLREYVRIRLDIIDSDRSLAELKTYVDRSNAIQESLWQQAKAVAASDTGMVPTGLFIVALNEMIDDQGNDWRRFATECRMLCYLGFLELPLLPAGLRATQVDWTRSAHVCHSISWGCSSAQSYL